MGILAVADNRGRRPANTSHRAPVARSLVEHAH